MSKEAAVYDIFCFLWVIENQDENSIFFLRAPSKNEESEFNSKVVLSRYV